MKFRPCIDIHDGKVKQIIGGTLTDNPGTVVENFVSDKDSAYYAEMFKRDGLSGGHVIMLGKGNDTEAFKALGEYPGGLQIGGGITSDNAEYYLEKGASHVIITSYVFNEGAVNYKNLDRLVSVTGKDRLVLDLSCRRKDGVYYVVTDRWQKFTEIQVNKKNLKELSGYCNEFLIHAADVEGLCSGIEEELVEILADCVDIPVTYAGGIRSFEDIDKIMHKGSGELDFTVGSALDIFGGSLPYNAVVKWCKNLSERIS